MRCFVFGTGRCGTVALSQAFEFATNYTTAHESNNSLLCYPDNHIEVNPQLRVRMGAVVTAYPDAIFVWLRRDIDKVAASYDRLDHGQWLNLWWSFCNTIRPKNNRHAAMIAVKHLERQCADAYAICPANRRRELDIDAIRDDFAQLWGDLGCTGDLAAALASFDTPQNTSQQRGDA